MMNMKSIVLFIGCFLFITSPTFSATNSVLLYSPSMGQLVTSSTLEWQSFTGEPNQLEFAVSTATHTLHNNTYSQYVCRALVEGIYTIGHTMEHHKSTVCIISMHVNVKTHFAFDLLINKGHGGKLKWQPWNKYSAVIPTGAVSAVNTGHIEDFYVARRKVNTDQAEHQGIDFNVGRFAPKQNLGKIIVAEGRIEKEYENGEVLVEIEPTRYELRDIKIDKWNRKIDRNLTYLGSAHLTNEDEQYSNLVETVLNYQYNRVRYWGTHDGVARGLPIKIMESEKPPYSMYWGLKQNEVIDEMKTVNTNLQPGTALNVTMSGNYTQIEAPYKATLISYFNGSDSSSSRRIEATVYMADMLDIKFEFSPAYWKHNNSFVPTTTTTTTTTTSTTVKPSTTIHSDIFSANDPALDTENEDTNDINSDPSDETVTEDKYSLKTVSNSKSSPTSSGYHSFSSCRLVLLISGSFAVINIIHKLIMYET